MNVSREFDRIFLDGISQSRDIKNEPLILGGFLTYLKLGRRERVAHPLSFSLHQNDESLSFSFPDANRWNIQFVKRLNKSPFFLSYMTTDHHTLQIVDFFSWTPEFTLHRIFKLSQTGFANKTSQKAAQPSLGKISGYSYISAGIEVTELKKQFNFSEENEINYIVIRKREFSSSEISELDIFKILRQEIGRYDENKISCVFETNSENTRLEIEKKWLTQRAIRSDLAVDTDLLNGIDIYDSEITAVVLLARYLNLKPVLKQVYDKIHISPQDARALFLKAWLAQELHKKPISLNKFMESNAAKGTFDIVLRTIVEPITSAEKLSDKEFPYVAFFAPSISDEQIIERLQLWWDKISLPLMEKRFIDSINGDPECMFLYALLALKYQMAWSGLLISKCNGFINWSLFSLLITLNQIVVKTYAWDGSWQVSAGPMITGNKISLNNSTEKVSYTSFGKKKYVSVSVNGKRILKFDQHWSVIASAEKNHFHLQPCISGMRYPESSYIELVIEDKSVYLPLVLAAGELYFLGIRCRWLFKKNRFQLTFFKKPSEKAVSFNGAVLDFNGKEKIVDYLNPEKQDPLIRCQVLDAAGRRFHFKTRSRQRSVWLYGFVQDRHGILGKSLNVVQAKRQQILNTLSSGHINAQINIPQNQKAIQLRIKRFTQIVKLHEYAERVPETVLKYSPLLSKGSMVIIVENAVSGSLAKIRNYFSREFGFEPLYINQKDVERKFQAAVLISITSGKKIILEKIDDGLSSKPHIRIGIDYILHKNLAESLLAVALDS